MENDLTVSLFNMLFYGCPLCLCRYVFRCDEWLAKDQSDGRIERVLSTKTEGEGKMDTGNLFQTNMQTSILNDHILFSAFYRKSKSTFTRVQRISCFVSILYLTMISNAMYYKTEENATPASALTIGPISISMNDLFTSVISTLTVTPAVVTITLMFTKSAPKRIYGKRVGRGKGQLPWWCIIFGWILVVLSLMTSAFFTILYSLQWGGVKSTAWLTCFLLSAVQSVIIVQPFKVRMF